MGIGESNQGSPANQLSVLKFVSDEKGNQLEKIICVFGEYIEEMFSVQIVGFKI